MVYFPLRLFLYIFLNFSFYFVSTLDMSSSSGEAPLPSDVNIISDVQLVPPSHPDAGATVDTSAGDDVPLDLSLPAVMDSNIPVAMEEAPAAAPDPVAPEGLGESIFEAERTAFVTFVTGPYMAPFCEHMLVSVVVSFFVFILISFYSCFSFSFSKHLLVIGPRCSHPIASL